MTGTWNPDHGRAYRERKRLGIPSSYIATLPWAERLELKIQRPEEPAGCWIWTGAKDWRGYGIAGTANHGSTTAHRDVYQHLVGPVPDDLELDHLCRVRACVNPAHLEIVTHQENSRRASHWWGKKADYKYGHPLSGDNVRVIPRGNGTKRECRECRRRYGREYRARRVAS